MSTAAHPVPSPPISSLPVPLHGGHVPAGAGPTPSGGQAPHHDEGPGDGDHHDAFWYAHTALAATAVLDPGPHPYHPARPSTRPPAVFTDHGDAARWAATHRSRLLAAVVHADASGHDEDAWTLACCLRRLHAHQGWTEDWLRTATAGLRAASRVGAPRARAALLESLGDVLVRRGGHAEGIDLLRKAVTLRRTLGDPAATLSPLDTLGTALLRTHRPTAALDVLTAARSTADTLQEHDWFDIVLGHIAAAHIDLGRHAIAENLLLPLLARHYDAGHTGRHGETLHRLSRALRGQHRPDEARTAIDQALAIANRLDDRAARPRLLLESGHVHAARGEHTAAQAAYCAAAEGHHRLADHAGYADALDALAVVLTTTGDVHDAADLHLHAAQIFEALHDDHRHARAMAGLAAALHAEDMTAAAHAALRTAHGLLEPHDDVPAVVLRDHIALALAR